jgi:hypothetical protein
MRKLTLIALLACAALVVAAPAVSASSAPVRLDFAKTATAPGVWHGSVSGDIGGALTTRLIALEVTAPIWHVTFDWIVDAGAASFTARLDGILNTETGAVVMDGTVISGFLLGAQVHEQGQLVDPAALEFVGSIRLMPATA